jgi:hypothetical protein
MQTSPEVIGQNADKQSAASHRMNDQTYVQCIHTSSKGLTALCWHAVMVEIKKHIKPLVVMLIRGDYGRDAKLPSILAASSGCRGNTQGWHVSLITLQLGNRTCNCAAYHDDDDDDHHDDTGSVKAGAAVAPYQPHAL